MTTTLSPNDDAMPAVVEADISLPGDAAAVLAMLDAYSSDPMADGHPLFADARANLIAGLRAAGWTVLRVWGARYRCRGRGARWRASRGRWTREGGTHAGPRLLPRFPLRSTTGFEDIQHPTLNFRHSMFRAAAPPPLVATRRWALDVGCSPRAHFSAHNDIL